jgi:hypothetical protein
LCEVRKNASDTCVLFSEAYGGEPMKKSHVFEWNKWFKEGHKNMEDNERSDHPRSHRTDENVENVLHLVHSDKVKVKLSLCFN